MAKQNYRGRQLSPTKEDLRQAFRNLLAANEQGDPQAAAALIGYHQAQTLREALAGTGPVLTGQKQVGT